MLQNSEPQRKICLFDMSDLDISRTYYSINIYKYRFLNSLNADESKKIVLYLNSNNVDYITRKFPQFKYIVYDKSFLLKLVRLGFFSRKIKEFLYKYRINHSKCDVFFSASNTDRMLKQSIKIPRVVVIHDIKSIWEKIGKKNGEKHYNWMMDYYRTVINNSSKAIAISKYTRDNIFKNIQDIDKDKLKVIYNSVCLPSTSCKPKNFKSRKYILYVNTVVENKNVQTLIKALRLITNQTEEDLIIVAKATPYWNNKVLPDITDLIERGKIICLENISNEELKYLYENASLFVSPSLNEGFGYTPIEAAMCKCPVICTECEALPDTTMRLVNYYKHPLDAQELADKMLTVLKNPPSEEELEYIADKYKKQYSPIKQKEEIFNLLNM